MMGLLLVGSGGRPRDRCPGWVGVARAALFGLGAEEARQVSLDPVGHLARGVALVLELDLHSQVLAAPELRRAGLPFHLLEDVQDPLAG